MTTRGICWYLCGLFSFSALISSALTVHPDLVLAWMLGTAAQVLGAVFFGIVAVVGRRIAVFNSRSLRVGLACFAVAATLFVLAVSVG